MTYRSSTRLFLFVTLALFAMGYVFRYFFQSHNLGGNSSLPPGAVLLAGLWDGAH